MHALHYVDTMAGAGAPAGIPSRSDVIAELARQRAALRAALMASALAPRTEGIMMMARDAIALTAREAVAEDLAVAATRLGGDPDLARGTGWPVEPGWEFEFVAQLNLADLAPFDVRDRLPQRGTLTFFTSHDQDYSVVGRVIFSAPEAALERVPRPADRPAALGVELSAQVVLPPYGSKFMPSSDDDYMAFYDEFYGKDDPEPHEPGSGLFGFDRCYDDLLSAEQEILLRIDRADAMPYRFEAMSCLYFLVDDRKDQKALDVRSFDAARAVEASTV